MMTLIEPEPGGEAEGILRVELSVPFSRDDLVALRGFFDGRGWPVEVEQIDAYLAGEDWRG